jgi:hypothetical protein
MMATLVLHTEDLHPLDVPRSRLDVIKAQERKLFLSAARAVKPTVMLERSNPLS